MFQPHTEYAAAAFLVLSVVVLLELGALRSWVSSLCPERDPKCDTHGHDFAIVDEYDDLREYERTYTVSKDYTALLRRGTSHQPVTVSGQRVDHVAVLECRFCDREKEQRKHGWWLPDDDSWLDEPVEGDIRDGIRAKAAAEASEHERVNDVLEGRVRL